MSSACSGTREKSCSIREKSSTARKNPKPSGKNLVLRETFVSRWQSGVEMAGAGRVGADRVGAGRVGVGLVGDLNSGQGQLFVLEIGG